MTGSSPSLAAALAALVVCVVVDSYLGATAHFLVPSLMLLALLLVGVAAHGALRRTHTPQSGRPEGDPPIPTGTTPGR
jgi:hypothetical protein